MSPLTSKQNTTPYIVTGSSKQYGFVDEVQRTAISCGRSVAPLLRAGSDRAELATATVLDTIVY